MAITFNQNLQYIIKDVLYTSRGDSLGRKAPGLVVRLLAVGSCSFTQVIG